MIKLHKLPEPEYLSQNVALWTVRLAERRALGEAPTVHELSRYNHPDIKLALIAETAGKCAYCEAKILHVAYGDIEHIVPKSLGDEFRFQWSNLTIACDICNTKKSNYDGIVDPYNDDVESIFSFIGPIIYPTDGEAAGYRTYVILDLNRQDLREKRYDRISYIETLLEIYRRTTDADIAKILKDDLINRELADTTEFAAAARSFVRARAPEIFETAA